MALSSEEHYVATITEDLETTCWGCGMRLFLPSYALIFKCGWCGAITNQNLHKPENKWFWWRRLRDRSFVCILLGFMLFVICGGVWAVYPVVFSISYFYGIFHSIITIFLAISTLSTFSLAAFRCAGTPPSILWGSYPAVGKGGLENYTFCHSCSKPKSPRTHHCRSCGMCVLDMDHHCPFIGNCVGAANHRHFIAFLISAIISTIYASIMSAYAGMHIWPPVGYRSPVRLYGLSGELLLRAAKESAKWKSPSRLITISTSDGKWHGKWSYDYLLSLQELNLQDLVEDEHNPDAMVSINLCIQKHASFGLSVDGRIITSFTRKCSNCFAPYCRQIDTNIKVWVLPSSKDDGEIQLPEIGGDDPSVIYVKPGYEAHLDSLVQDTLRLATSSQDSCSESCAKAEPKLHYTGVQNFASLGKRWCRLLELRNPKP